MPKWTRAIFALMLAAVVLPAAASASTRMPIGFYDDATFRWSTDRVAQLAAAEAAGASVIHTNASWATIAPTRPANPSNGDDPTYVLSDLDQLVSQASQDGLRVYVTIVGTPKWANGGQTPNHMPKKLSDLTTFSKMLANRYDGAHGHGTVSMWSCWNEPNLQLFLTPQFSGTKIVSPSLYAKLYKAVYAGVHAGNPSAAIAIGETSPEGRDKPTAKSGQGQSVAPGTFAQMLAKTKGLKFTAYAEHPYPIGLAGKPLGKSRYPNVTLSNLHLFEKNLAKWFHRDVPVWITEYGHQTKPEQRGGVSYATQKAYLKQALTYAKNDPDVQMFIWFTFRDSATNPWRSGLEKSSGAHKPAYAEFTALANSTRGTYETARAKSTNPTVKLYVPALAYYSLAQTVGITYTIKDNKGRLVSKGEPQSVILPDQSVSFHPKFRVDPDNTYTVTAEVNDANGHVETAVTFIQPVK